MPNISASLERMAVPVVAMRPPTNEPQLAVGFIEEGPLGHCVGIGVAASMPGAPGAQGLCLMAHIQPGQARDLAAKLLAAAERAEAMGPSTSPFIAKAQPAPANDGPEVPEKAHIQGEARGFACQIQKGAEEPGTTDAGIVAIMAGPAPDDGRPVLCIHLAHPDSSAMCAILEADELDKFMDLLSHGASQFAAIARPDAGAPEGVSIQ